MKKNRVNNPYFSKEENKMDIKYVEKFLISVTVRKYKPKPLCGLISFHLNWLLSNTNVGKKKTHIERGTIIHY